MYHIPSSRCIYTTSSVCKHIQYAVVCVFIIYIGSVILGVVFFNCLFCSTVFWGPALWTLQCVLTALPISILWLYHILFIHLPIEKHIGCCQFFCHYKQHRFELSGASSPLDAPMQGFPYNMCQDTHQQWTRAPVSLCPPSHLTWADVLYFLPSEWPVPNQKKKF